MLTATASAEMAAGDVFVIETPGGGGYGGCLPATGEGTREAVEGSRPQLPLHRFAWSPSPCRGGLMPIFRPAGILIVVAGFALRLNPMLVVTAAALATGLHRRHGPGRGRSPLFGKAFNDNRIIAIVWIVLPVIGLLERYGLQQRARGLIRDDEGGDGRPAADRLSAVPPGRRPRSGLTSIAGHPQTVRPLVAPMALGRGREAAWRARRGRRAETVKAYVRRDRQCRPVLRRGHLHRHRLDHPDPGDAGDLRLSRSRRWSSPIWAIPTAIAAFLIHGFAAAAASTARLAAARSAAHDHAAMGLYASPG